MLPARRTVPILIGVGLILLATSIVLIMRDVRSGRAAAEAEVLAVAETGALALERAAQNDVKRYLEVLLKHPAVAMATVYSAAIDRTTVRRPPAFDHSFLTSSLWREPVVGCRAAESTTLCLEGDPSYFQRRAVQAVIPHLVLLAGSALLLFAAILLGRGQSGRDLSEITQILRGAADENNFAVRARGSQGPIAALAAAVNALLEQMQERDVTLRRRTTELESANRELEAFSYSVSHDLRSPLASIDGFSQALADGYGDKLDETAKEYLHWIQEAAAQMTDRVAGLLQMSRISRSEIQREPLDLTAMASTIAGTLRQKDAGRRVDFRIESGLFADGDRRLLHAVLENLMSNAWKFTSKRDEAVIAVGSALEGGRRAFFVRDNGAGFDSTKAARMFTPFQRLHSATDFAGTGIGLSTVKRIIERHGGAIWADGETGKGATFYFTLGETAASAVLPEAGQLTSV
jgi:signal transduction histidine kinase